MIKQLCLAGLCVLLLAGCGAGQTTTEPASAQMSVTSENSATVKSAQPVKVACVGDSNTEGYGSTSYTNYLAQRLGDHYVVTNYGESGTTAVHSYGYPYINCDAYKRSLNASPDVVVLMFGTNDTTNWHNKDTFEAEYDELVTTYMNLDSKPRVILCTPPAPHLDDTPGVKHSGVQPAVYGELIKAIRETADKHDLTLVDVYTLTKNYPDWFLDDGIHLAEQGANAVAVAVANAIAGR